MITTMLYARDLSMLPASPRPETWTVETKLDLEPRAGVSRTQYDVEPMRHVSHSIACAEPLMCITAITYDRLGLQFSSSMNCTAVHGSPFNINKAAFAPSYPAGGDIHCPHDAVGCANSSPVDSRRRFRIPPVASEEQCELMRRVALECAYKVGLRGDDAVDCEFGFVQEGLAKLSENPYLVDTMFGAPALLFRYATNYAINTAKRMARWTARSVSLDCLDDVQRYKPSELSPNPEELPEAHLMSSASRSRVGEALGRLTPAHRTLVVRHVLNGESLAEIAAAAGRSSDSVRQEYRRVILRLRRMLTGED